MFPGAVSVAAFRLSGFIVDRNRRISRSRASSVPIKIPEKVIKFSFSAFPLLHESSSCRDEKRGRSEAEFGSACETRRNAIEGKVDGASPRAYASQFRRG